MKLFACHARLRWSGLMAALLMLVWAGVAGAAPRAKITAYTVTDDNQLLVTITDENGARPVVAEKEI